MYAKVARGGGGGWGGGKCQRSDVSTLLVMQECVAMAEQVNAVLYSVKSRSL